MSLEQRRLKQSHEGSLCFPQEHSSALTRQTAKHAARSQRYYNHRCSHLLPRSVPPYLDAGQNGDGLRLLEI